MPTLEEIQEEINLHDDVLLDALKRRIQLTRRERQLQPRDAAREDAIKIKARSIGGGDSAMRNDFERFAEHVINIVETIAARYPL